jgi:hypothetical protein
MSNRSDTEQVLRDLFNGYRNAPLTTDECVRLAMQALDNKSVFVRRAPAPAASTHQPTDLIDNLITGLNTVSVEHDDDDNLAYLYCCDCENSIQYDVGGVVVSRLMEMANEHWKASHT